MAGGAIQLVVYGAKDLFITGTPQITFFKVVYRRHTNFAVQQFNHGFTDGPGFGRLSVLKLFRLGDLINKMVLSITITNVKLNPKEKFAWVRRLGYAIINSITVEIGGQTIDKQYGEWLEIWYELARTGKHEKGFAKMLGDVPSLTEYNNTSKPRYTLLVPLRFWFNRFIGLALPIVAIHYHDILIKVRLSKLEDLIVTNSCFDINKDIRVENLCLITDYIYLDLPERKQFAVSMHEYLIEQVQFTGESSVINPFQKTLLNDFNFPMKELFWFVKDTNYTTSKRFLCYTHLEDWTEEILRCSKEILENSIYLSAEGCSPRLPNLKDRNIWEIFHPSVNIKTKNNKIQIINNSKKILYVNTSSLIYNDNNITDKIYATIQVNDLGDILITDVETEINKRDISIPVTSMIDTRLYENDVFVNQFINHGLYITGNTNPVEFTKLEYNSQERFEKRNGNFFNYLQPELHHNNTPTDGVNVYSFAIHPEDHQPSGTSNFSVIDNILLSIWVNEKIKNGKLYVFGKSYNILRISNGLVGLTYTN